LVTLFLEKEEKGSEAPMGILGDEGKVRERNYDMA
jgi:hypothetical protein